MVCVEPYAVLTAVSHVHRCWRCSVHRSMRAIRSASTVSAAGCSCTFPSAVAAVENLIDCMSWRTCALQLNQQRKKFHTFSWAVCFSPWIWWAVAPCQWELVHSTGYGDTLLPARLERKPIRPLFNVTRQHVSTGLHTSTHHRALLRVTTRLRA